MSFGGSGRRRSGRGRTEARETPNTPVNWRRLFGYLNPYKLRLIAALLALVFYSAIGLAFPLVIIQLLTSVLNQKDPSQLNNLALGLIGLFLLQSAATFLQSYNLTYIGERIILDLRTALFSHLQSLS